MSCSRVILLALRCRLVSRHSIVPLMGSFILFDVIVVTVAPAPPTGVYCPIASFEALGTSRALRGQRGRGKETPCASCGLPAMLPTNGWTPCVFSLLISLASSFRENPVAGCLFIEPSFPFVGGNQNMSRTLEKLPQKSRWLISL